MAAGDGDITDADAASNWRMTVPYAYPAEESAMTALRKNLTNLRLGAYVTEATTENLTAYGLDTPQFTLTLHMAAGTTGVTNDDGTYATKDWPESTFVLKIGDAKSDMVDYVQVDNGIYLCSHFSLATFRGLNPKDTISRYPLMVSLDDVVGLTVTDSSGITTYTLTREEQVAENNELVRDSNGNIQYNVTCLCNGEEMSYDVFAAQWEQFSGASRNGLASQRLRGHSRRAHELSLHNDLRQGTHALLRSLRRAPRRRHSRQHSAVLCDTRVTGDSGGRGGFSERSPSPPRPLSPEEQLAFEVRVPSGLVPPVRWCGFL